MLSTYHRPKHARFQSGIMGILEVTDELTMIQTHMVQCKQPKTLIDTISTNRSMTESLCNIEYSQCLYCTKQ